MAVDPTVVDRDQVEEEDPSEVVTSGQRGDREMHHAVCSNCGKDCEVPFKPTGSEASVM